MSVFAWCEHTNTIRVLPENYLVAQNINGEWRMVPDAAVPTEALLHVTKILHENHDVRWSRTGLTVLAAITPYNIK